MNVTQDVILDLLPPYLAGEASPATRLLVDQFLKEHPEIAERVRASAEKPWPDLAPVSPPPQLELRALRRTMRLLSWQHRLFASGIWLTAFSLMTKISFQGGHAHVHFLLPDYPAQLGVCAQLAVLSWIGYFLVRYRLRGRVPHRKLD